MKGFILFAGPFALGFVVLLIFSPFLGCCCCCPNSCPSQCCRKDEDELYSKCELKCPSAFAIIAFGIAIGAGAFGKNGNIQVLSKRTRSAKPLIAQLAHWQWYPMTFLTGMWLRTMLPSSLASTCYRSRWPGLTATWQRLTQSSPTSTQTTPTWQLPFLTGMLSWTISKTQMEILGMVWLLSTMALLLDNLQLFLLS